MKLSDKKQNIIDKYLEIAKNKKALPNYADFMDHSITRDMIKHHYSNITKLHEFVEKNFQKKLKSRIVKGSDVFDSKKFESSVAISYNMSQKYIVTTAVSGKAVHKGFFSTLKNFCKSKGYKLIIIPCVDSNKNQETTFDPVLNDPDVIFATKNTMLTVNIGLMTIKINSNQVNPLNGLARLGNRGTSLIYASPKQALESVPLPNINQNHFIMTTGAITCGESFTSQNSKVQNLIKKTDVISEWDHVLGAIIIDNDWFTQIQADKRGRFSHLGKLYNGNMELDTEVHAILGDMHAGETCPVVLQTYEKLASTINISNQYLHDFFSGYSISHHDHGIPLKMAAKYGYSGNRSSLAIELETGARLLEQLSNCGSGRIVRVKGNHDEVLEKYLERGNYVHDKQNHKIALHLALQYLEKHDVLQFAYSHYANLDPSVESRIDWLDRNSNHTISGCQLAAHGDLGPNGTFASLVSLEKCFGNAIVGHSHSSAILRGIMRMGTFTRLRLSYNKGSSNWNNSLALLHPKTRTKQLLHMIDGSFLPQ